MRPALALPLLLALAAPDATAQDKSPWEGFPIQKLLQTNQPVLFGPPPSQQPLPVWVPPPAPPPPDALSTDEHIRDGVALNRAQCPALTDAIWLRVRERDFCVRYWVSTVGGSSEAAVVFVHGDIGGHIDGKWQLADPARRITAASAQDDVDGSSRVYHGPYVAIARPGAFGSAGHHINDRRTWTEFQVIDAALDAIKLRHRFTRLHLVGSSGGGLTVAALVRRRDDIGCAVMASAPLSLATWHRLLGSPHSQERTPLYDPIEHVVLMRPRPGTRLIVLSDPDDKIVPFAAQREYVEHVRDRGLPILHVLAHAHDERSHGLSVPAIRLAIDCAHGVDDQALVARYHDRPLDPRTVALRPAIELSAPSGCRGVLGLPANPACSRPLRPQVSAGVRGDRLPLPTDRALNLRERAKADGVSGGPALAPAPARAPIPLRCGAAQMTFGSGAIPVCPTGDRDDQKSLPADRASNVADGVTFAAPGGAPVAPLQDLHTLFSPQPLR